MSTKWGRKTRRMGEEGTERDEKRRTGREGICEELRGVHGRERLLAEVEEYRTTLAGG